MSGRAWSVSRPASSERLSCFQAFLGDLAWVVRGELEPGQWDLLDVDFARCQRAFSGEANIAELAFSRVRRKLLAAPARDLESVREVVREALRHTVRNVARTPARRQTIALSCLIATAFPDRTAHVLRFEPDDDFG